MAFPTSGNAPQLAELIPAVTQYTSQSWSFWNNPESLADYAGTLTDSSFWLDSGRRTVMGRKQEFTGVWSLPAAIDLCRNGWPDGAARVARLRDSINAKHPVSRQLATYAVAGALPNVQRALAGNPMHMRRLDSAKARQRPVITLIAHLGGLADVPAATFINKAAVVAAVVDSIESAGYSCHVIGLSQVHASYHMAGIAVTVKEAGESLDIGKLAFSIGHVAMLRRLIFACRFSDNVHRPLVSSGLTLDVTGDRATNVYVFPSMNINASHFRTERDAESIGLAHLIETLRSQGCPAFPTQDIAA